MNTIRPLSPRHCLATIFLLFCVCPSCLFAQSNATSPIAQLGFGSITGVAYSPDNSKILVGGINALLIDATSGTTLRLLAGHTGNVTCVAYSPDGSRLATGSTDKTARLWDAATGQLLYVYSGHTNQINSVDFSPNSARIVTSSSDGTVRIWSTLSGEHFKTLTGHLGAVYWAVYSANNARILTAGHDGYARLWDATSGVLLYTFVGHTNIVRRALFLPDGSRILTGGEDRVFKIWDLNTGAELKTISNVTQQIVSLAVSPDGNYFASGTSDGFVRLGNLTSQSIYATLPPTPDYSTINAVAFSRDSQQVLAGGSNLRLRIWSVSGTLLRSIDRAASRVVFLPGTAENRVIADSTLWDDSLTTPLLVYESIPIATTHSGDRLLIGGTSARILDAATGAVVRTIVTPIQNGTFSRDGSRVVTSFENVARMWDASTGDLLRIFTGNIPTIEGLALSPDGTRLATAHQDQIRIWDANVTGGPVQTILNSSNAVGFSPDSKLIFANRANSATVSGGVWDLATGNLVRQLVNDGQWSSVSARFSRDGRYAIIGTNQAFAALWDLSNGRLLRKFSHALLGSFASPQVWHVAISPDNTRILTGGVDGTVKLWDVSNLTASGAAEWLVYQ